jgi:hypothetical protein
MEKVDDFDLEELLQAHEARTSARIAIYLPNKDRNQEDIDAEPYIMLGMRLMAEMNLGVTRMPVAQGMWIDEENQREVVEDTVVLYSFIRRPELFQSNFRRFVDFLHRFGRDCKQGEVLIEYSGPFDDDERYIE